MTVAKIHGAEFPVRKIFSDDFCFRIPMYQRPYSWTTEQAGELLDDLLGFIGDDPETEAEELSPYFLGSIVVIKEEGRPEAEVVDGQQRLTTLTILLAALRHTIEDKKYAKPMTAYLYEEGNAIEGTPNRYRLTVRERDADFFREHVQSGGLPGLKALDPGQLTDSRRNIRDNALLFLHRLSRLPDEQRIRLGQFVVLNCLLVVVSTPDLDSAYRIFSILNDRGLELSHADILKSEVIGRVPAAEQEAYNRRWEDAEEDLGREAFGDLFGHIRTIFRKQKMRESILKEFREYVIKAVDGGSKALIDGVLIPFSDSLSVIRTAGYESAAGAETVNGLLRWLNRIDNTDWLPPAILFAARHKGDPAALRRFLADLERLAAFLMVCRYGVNDRLERYGRLLSALQTGEDLYAEGSALQLTPDERREFLRELDGDLYRQTAKRRLYVLLRLDSALSDGSATYQHGVVSIEHVLPQNPKPDSDWCRWFPTPGDRDRWVHRLGNLLLLTHNKNSSAGNYDFARKKTAYFAKGGISPFPLTTQVLTESEWTEQVVARRQAGLLGVLDAVWRLDGNSDSAVAGSPFEEFQDEKLSAAVRMTSPEENEKEAEAARQTTSATRVWTQDEVGEAFAREGDPDRTALLRLAKELSVGGKVVSPAPKQNATFGVFLKGRLDSGATAERMLFICALGSPRVTVYLSAVEALAGTDAREEFRRRLKRIFGDAFNAEQKGPGIPASALVAGMTEFRALIRRVQDAVAERAVGDLGGEPGSTS